MIRIVRGSPATLSAPFYVNDTATDLDAVPTVLVTRQDGSQVATGAATRVGVGQYTYALPAQTDLAVLTAVWSGLISSQPISVTTYVEVVGAEYFSIAELRNSDSVLTNTTRYPDAKCAQARLAVESDFEGICGRAFVPRYAREQLVSNGTGTLWLSNPEPIRLITLTVNGEDWSGKTITTSTDNLRILILAGFQGVWPRYGQITIEYEYGNLAPPERVKNAAMKWAKYKLVADQSRIDERATTMNIPDFGNFVMATPGMRESITGIPEVDVVLWDYTLDRS